MRILVTGSAGHIGSAVVEKISQHADWVGIDIQPGPWTTAVGSINDVPFLEPIVSGVDAIIHCAAFHAPHVGAVPDSKFREVNVNGTENLLNLALKHDVKRFVYTSTTSVYGGSTRPKTKAVWLTEDVEPHAEDIYDHTKLAAEFLCADAARSGMTTAVLRMSRCFPEPDHLMAFYRLYRGVSRVDVANAHWLSVSQSLQPFEIFNISADPPFSIADCPNLITDPWPVIDAYYAGSSDRFKQLGWPLPPSIDRVYVIDKAKEKLGYRPEENFEELLASYLEAK